MIKKLFETIYGRDYELRERIFRMISLVGICLAGLGIIECLLLMDVHIIVIPLVILLTVMGVVLLATFKYRKISFVSSIVGFLIILVVFPSMFFLSGGLEGGAVLWFSLGIFYVFLMFSGKKLVLFLILTLTADFLTYLCGYYYPEAITPMDSRAAAYFDSIFAMLAVGFAGGAILKAQLRMFYIEQNVTKKQQEELAKMSDSKNSFFASMSHEIRTPINTIIGLNEIILRESQEDTTKGYAQNIQNASKMLLSLVNDILDLSQIEVKKMEIVPVEYHTEELFGNLIDMIQVRLNEKKLELRIDIDENLPSVLYGDVKRINQVLLNLLTNAAKYTEHGSVTFSAHMESFGEDLIGLKISVTDTGIGIRKENLQYLYDAFRRADVKRNLKIEGSGLGLSITKQLVDLMDGEITVDSIYTKGSVFTVILPQPVIDKTPIGNLTFLSRNRQITGTYEKSFEAPEARILIVDDNAMNTMVECELLKATKVQIDTAHSGAECLEMTIKKYYHVILLDYMMPEMDGVETLRQLRKQENGLCRDSAIIVLSASSVTEAGQDLLEETFDGYLEKPIQGTALEQGILKFLPEDIIEYRKDQSAIIESNVEIRKVSHHKRKKIYITTDCICDLPEYYIEKYDIGIMYLYINTESGRFADTREIATDSLNQYVTETTSTAVATSVSVEEYETFFADMLTQAEQVIHISMAKNVGKSYETALTAAKGFGHVHVIDSGLISGGQGLVVLYAARLALWGYTGSDILQMTEKMKKKIESHFMMPSATIFHQHGYTGKVPAKICELFGLHPTMKMNQSKICITGARFGTKEDAWKRFIHWHLLRKKRINNDIIFISHAGCSVEQLDLIRREIKRHYPFKKVIVQRTSVSIACSTGIGTIGFSYYVNASDRDFES